MSRIINLSDVRPITATLPPRILIHGQPGAGKTTLASRFPSPVILDIEHGVPSGISIPGLSISDYDEMLTAIRALGGEHGYHALIVDGIDALEPLVWAAVCSALGVKSIETPGYGKGYVEADAYWRRFLNGLDWLRSRGMTIILIAHSAPEIVSDPRAASYTSYQLRVHRRARGIIQDWADAIGFLATDVVVHSEEIGFNKTRGRGDGGSTRWLHWEGRPAFTAKNRYRLPAKMLCPIDFDFSKQLQPFFPHAAVREEITSSAATVAQGQAAIAQ